jgi:hypothetical protein
MHAHVSEKYHNTQPSEILEHHGRYYITRVYGMVESQMLVQLLPLVLKRVPSDCEEVPFPSCTYINFPDALLCSILCTKPEVVLVLVWLILGFFPLVPIFFPRFVKNSHLVEAWSFLDSLDNLPWLRSSSTVPRNLLRWISIVALKEFSSEVVILGCTIPSGDIRELDALASQWNI